LDPSRKRSNSSSILPVCWPCGADAEVDVRLGNLQLVEENVGQLRIVVLAGVHDHVADLHAAGAVVRFDGGADRR
jgi:cob(I)alamin adenosyltransferase